MKFQLFVISLLLPLLSISQSRQYFSEIPLFENGKSGFSCFRIPAIVKAPNGDLLAFAEGRVNDCNDFGNIDIVMRSSTDNGMSWGEVKVVAEYESLQAGNPAPVVDLMDPQFPDGRIFLFYNTGIATERETREGKGLREVFYISSIDNGMTWSKPNNITAQVHRPNYPPKYTFSEDWRSYANTPGHAIQLTKGKHKGRIFIPANHSTGNPQNGFNDYRAHAYYSDDHGDSWHLSDDVEIPSSNESTAVQLSDGTVMQNIRYQNGESKYRIVALSRDGGMTWDTTYLDKNLPDPVCQASILEYESPAGNKVLLFSNPNSQDSRNHMTVRVSFDDGQTWLLSREIRHGESAYSDLVIQSDDKIGILYEHGNQGGIHYAHFNWAWLTNSKNHTDNPWVKKLVSKDLAKDFDFQLAPPMLQFESLFFTESLEVSAKLDYPGVHLHYTLDGENPNENAPKISGHLSLSESGNLKIKAFHDHCRPSDVVEAQFFKIGKLPKIKNATLTNPPNEQYPGGGANALFDYKKGTTNFREPVWMGFSESDCEVLVEFEKKICFKKITISTLADTRAWIFPPSAIEIFASENGREYEKIHGHQFDELKIDISSSLQFFPQTFENHKSKYLKIIIKNYGTLPEWHPGKGYGAWLFLDEILVE